MVWNKKVKDEMNGLSTLLNDEDGKNSEDLYEDINIIKESLIYDGRDDGYSFVPELVAASSPSDINAFQQAIREIPGYSVELLNNGSFLVSKTEDGKKVEILKGDKEACKMASPLDRNILKAYINAHKGEIIIVDRCKTKQAAQQLLDTCKNSNPKVNIKFPADMLKNLGFDSWVCSTHSLSPSMPVEQVRSDIELKSKSKPGSI